MRSFIPLLAFAAAASAATSQLDAREDAQACAMKTLLSSSACNAGDAACLCSDATRHSVMEEIRAACGAEQSEATDKLASEACKVQKVRRAYQPSVTVVHNALATPSSVSDNSNGVQQADDSQECTCANQTPTMNSESPMASDTTDTQQPTDTMTSDNDNSDSSPSHGVNTPTDADSTDKSAQSSHTHGPSMMATPVAAAAASSAARFGAMTTPSSQSSAATPPTPSGADAFSTFQGAGALILPSMTIVAGGVLAGIVGTFAAL